MFLNILPITSFLVLCLLLNASDELHKRKLIPEFIAGKPVAAVMGTIVLLWGLFQFYANLNYFIYQINHSPIAVLLRLIVVMYFIASGFIISFKGIGEKLFTKQPEAKHRYELLKHRLSEMQLFMTKIAVLLLILFIVNYLFV